MPTLLSILDIEIIYAIKGKMIEPMYIPNQRCEFQWNSTETSDASRAKIESFLKGISFSVRVTISALTGRFSELSPFCLAKRRSSQLNCYSAFAVSHLVVYRARASSTRRSPPLVRRCAPVQLATGAGSVCGVDVLHSSRAALFEHVPA